MVFCTLPSPTHHLTYSVSMLWLSTYSPWYCIKGGPGPSPQYLIPLLVYKGRKYLDTGHEKDMAILCTWAEGNQSGKENEGVEFLC